MSSNTRFHGDRLRLARLLSSLSLDELGERVAASRQYLHQLETEAKSPSQDMRVALAAALGVLPSFFSFALTSPVREDHCHFRRLSTAPRSLTSQAAARGTLVEMLVEAIEERVRLPVVDVPDLGRPDDAEGVERAAERARVHWRLGDEGPITNMTRVVENAGVVVVHLPGISERIDALSIARRRPIIVRATAKKAAVRLRFDIAHECAHLVMHQGVVTGDAATEDQAHRFASAFLIPRGAFAKEFPRSRRALDWYGIFGMKLRWRVSARAITRRAYDLGLIDAAQYRTANVHLVKTGQSKVERYDDELDPERPELLPSAVRLLRDRDPGALPAILDQLGLCAQLVEQVLDQVPIGPRPSVTTKAADHANDD
ncbi:XRE family transcriptional regulator [Lichenibacterium ramalinae]|uniref:XRE family transcriptional regulator n=1 Tax=Lichenibacterium ramalinae TaxID=2316527 RepID=UPI001A913BC8|nr:XRE family transcriptional regulator [Lichenibacterium ramalinae]